MNKITILGSGTSTGVPILGCPCRVCKSQDVRNKRLRTSALIQLWSGQNILIDASPDLRTQALTNDVDHMEAVIITHDHADHTHGMDDLRPYGYLSQKAMNVFTDKQCAETLREKFPYIFQREKIYKEKEILGGGIPLLDLAIIEKNQATILGEDFHFYPLPHGHTTSLAVRHGKMAYVIDCQSIPDEIVKILRDSRLELLIIDCLRFTPHQTHLHLDLTLDLIKAIGPKLAVLTHMGHELDYLELTSELLKRRVKNIIPAQDNQCFLYSRS